MNNFNNYQQEYCLNAAANAVGTSVGTPAQLLSAFDAALNKALTGTDWTVTWGPAIFQTTPKQGDPPQGPDNAWYVAVNSTTQTAVVAVAGTAMHSKAGQAIDVDVESTVDFNAWVSQWSNKNGVPYADAGKAPTEASPFVSVGTCRGVTNILSTQSTLASSGQYLYGYLQSLTNGSPKDYTVIFTGHSMGGALTPTMALGLQQANMIGPANAVYVLPSAGATPGNEAFVTAYSSGFAVTGSGYQGYNADLYNTNDIVPQAWSVEDADDRNLDNIKKIWGNAPNWWQYQLYLTTAKVASNESHMKYRPIPGSAFTSSPPPSGSITITALLQQHAKAYWDYIGITAWVQQFVDTLAKEGAPQRSEKDYPVEL